MSEETEGFPPQPFVCGLYSSGINFISKPENLLHDPILNVISLDVSEKQHTPSIWLVHDVNMSVGLVIEFPFH